MANIKVAVRVRPISEREMNFTGSEIVVHTEEKAISLTNLKVSSSKAGDSRERTRRYGFDYCFDSSVPGDEKYASQAKIYEALGESILDVLFSGYNSCLVAYGQSASGKTYTMMGSKEDPGLTPRICEGLFLRLTSEEKNNTNFDVSVSYLEVYNERVRDLLRPSSSPIGLRVREHPRLGPYVQGLTRHAVPSLESLISRVAEGTRSRKTASTLQNPTSSRSHALLTLSLQPSTSNSGQSVSDETTTSRRNDHFPRGSKLHLVDLAGSESAAACGGINRLKEGANINKSLVALGNVISALAERGSTGSGPGRRFIPYRDSALTWLLKDALGGNATTVMLATISPASGSYNETSHTLRFAQRAQSVVNRPVINEDPVSRIIKELRAEVARLKSLLVEKNVDPDSKSICMCHCVSQRVIEAQNQKTGEPGRIEPEGEKPEVDEEYEVSIETNDLRIPERRHSTSEGLPSYEKLSSPFRRFGSFEVVHESRNSSLNSREADGYNRAKVSELIIDDVVDEPVFVDIPTLVAVLIKPDDNIGVGDHQIEEISSDGVPEDVTDVEFSDPLDNHVSNVSAEDIACLEHSDDRKVPSDSSVSCVESRISREEKGRLKKHGSIDANLPPKSSSNLQSSKKYGSIESLPRKREVACPFQRSQTNLDKRNGSLDRIKKLNNIKEVEDQRSGKSVNSWRQFGSWPSRDFQRKGSNDSDKSLKDSALFAKSRNQPRKQSVDGIRRKTSKDSSSSSSKDELLLSGGGQTREKTGRKGSLEHESIPTRAHTPIQRGRRAEIVAAVTERLYSSKKAPEDITLTGTTSSTPGSEVRSVESTDVKLASATRMRLQEISRKMLAKRRRICVDTQTDNHHQTVRVRDVSCITEEPKIISRDASILTDRHEDYEILPYVDCPVRRVKEIATCTDSDLKQPVVRCRDAGNLTEYYEDYGTMTSPRNDSGIMSDDTQNYAESNLSSTEISDLSPIRDGRRVELVENSTSTGMPSGLPDSGSQTRKEDLAQAGCLNCEPRCCGGRRQCRGNYGIDHSGVNDSCHHAERNVISISLPEMMNITIETSNGMESKIRVFDGNESIDDRAIVSLKDNVAQTEKKIALEIGTSTDDSTGQVYFRDFSTSTKPMIGQPDGKTFRIENIFHEANGGSRITPSIEIIGSSLDDAATANSLIVTNSIGTSFVPETRENATEMGGSRSSRSPLFSGSPAVRSLPHVGFMKNTWPSRWRTGCSGSSMQTNVYDAENALHQKEKHPILGSDKIMQDRVSSKDPPAQSKLEYLMTNGQSPSVIDLKSPPIIAMLNRKICVEQDSNFSDDSLDLTEDPVTNNDKICKPLLGVNDEVVEAIKMNEKVCPPDLVAHTKKNSSDSTVPMHNSTNKFEDFDEESQHIEFPKAKLNDTTESSFATPMKNFKTLILGDSCYPVNLADDSDLTDFENQSSTDTLMDSEDYRYATIDVVEDMEQCLVNGGSPDAPRSIIKNPFRAPNNPRTSRKSSYAKKDIGNENSSTRKVRFAIPEVNRITSSDSEGCENLVSDAEEFVEEGPRTILEEYLDEAVVFMRNMNSMNEYMSGACVSDKHTIRGHNRRRGKARSKNYIEYEGRRISLEDDADKSVGSDDDDDLDFNVESYDKCLKSMDRLEECLARVKRHDEILRSNYGIGKDGSTGAKLDLARFSIDSNDSKKDLNDGHRLVDTCPKKISNGNDTIAENDGIDDGNNKLQLRGKDEEDLASKDLSPDFDIAKKPRTRKPRFYDMRKSNPTTYTQLRSKYGCVATDTRKNTKTPTSGYGLRVEASQIGGAGDAIVLDNLKIPDCHLTLPETTRKDDGPFEGSKKSGLRQRFSLSKYDSSDESSSSNEALASFIDSIDNVARSRDKFQYPGSPRAKFLQLLSERRRIVENTRSTGVS